MLPQVSLSTCVADQKYQPDPTGDRTLVIPECIRGTHVPESGTAPAVTGTRDAPIHVLDTGDSRDDPIVIDDDEPAVPPRKFLTVPS